MSLKIITVGDKTDHGGTVISGSPNHDIRGRAIARLGDSVACPQSYPGGKTARCKQDHYGPRHTYSQRGACRGRGMHDGMRVQADRQLACDGRLKTLVSYSMPVEERQSRNERDDPGDCSAEHEKLRLPELRLDSARTVQK